MIFGEGRGSTASAVTGQGDGEGGLFFSGKGAGSGGSSGELRSGAVQVLVPVLRGLSSHKLLPREVGKEEDRERERGHGQAAHRALQPFPRLRVCEKDIPLLSKEQRQWDTALDPSTAKVKPWWVEPPWEKEKKK